MKFLKICFIKYLEGDNDSLVIKPKKLSNVSFWPQNKQLKPKINCKNNGKLTLQACFSRNYDFAFTNLLKMGHTFLELTI